MFRALYPDCTKGCRDPKSTNKADHAGLCRVLYGRHLDFFRAGVKHRERNFLAANRVGKSICAAFELVCHLSGEYPGWWEGRRLTAPSQWWLAGDTMLTTRNVLQVIMLGPIDGVETQTWTGMLPADLIVGKPTRKSGGISQCIDTVRVRHKHGGVITSSLQFMSYDQGRRAFQGTSRHCWLDEEPPDNEDIYGECLTRALDIDGMVLMTFTPLRGLTPFLAHYVQTSVYLERDGTESPASAVFGVSVQSDK